MVIYVDLMFLVRKEVNPSFCFAVLILSHQKTSKWLTVFEIALYTLLINHGAILNLKFMMSFAESNLSSCADFITLDRSKSNVIVKRRVQERSVSFLAPYKYYLR